MIHNLSNTITTFFFKKNMIETSEIAIFCYGMEVIVSTFVGISTIILISAFLKNISFGILYLLYIVPIRMYVGGYHAKSYLKCNIVFSCFFIIALLCYQNMGLREYKILSYFNLMSTILIFNLAPLENKNKLIEKSKKKIYRNIDVLFYIVGGIVGICFKHLYWINILTIVITNVTILLLIGKGEEVYERTIKK